MIAVITLKIWGDVRIEYCHFQSFAYIVSFTQYICDFIVVALMYIFVIDVVQPMPYLCLLLF